MELFLCLFLKRLDMSKRKLATSYASLRRQVNAQVAADLQFIANDNNESGDESADDTTCSYHTFSSCNPNPSAVSGDSDADTDDVVSNDSNCIPQPPPCYVGDFDDCHWADLETDSGTDDEQVDSNKGDIFSQVNEWANKYGLPHVAITELMHILKPHFSVLPYDSRTLLHTPRSFEVKQLKSGGEYCHLGLAKGLQQLLTNGPFPQGRCLELQFNVDGMPLFRSSNACLWPILCKLKYPNYQEPFVVGIYHGNEKLGDASEFLAEFVAELSALVKDGVNVADTLHTVKIHSFVCDAPARAFMKGIKFHSGYAACEKCIEYGEYHGKVIHPGTNAPLRTDVAFNEMTDKEHHSGPCPLKQLSVGCVSQFGLDYMHMVCLGVVRRLLLYWKGPTGPLSVRIGSRAVNELSHKLVSLCPHIPCEFARRPRSFIEILRWKATEFRQFLLYTGPVILGSILSWDLFCHFMLLSVAVRILACPQLALTFCDYANELLLLFVSTARKLYGKEICVYNIHCLIHLANDVKNLGALDDFSSFPFENKLGQLKKIIRKPQYPIQQIVYRLAEKQQAKPAICGQVHKKSVVKTEHSNGPLLADYRSYRQYKCLQADKYKVSLCLGNNCVLTANGSPALVKNILDKDGTVVLLCHYFVTAEDAFTYPLPSSKLGIYKVSDKMTDIFALPLYSVAQKCALLPMKDSFVVLPLLH